MLIERLVETKIQPWLSKKLFTNKLENKKNKLIIDHSFEHWPLEDMSFEQFMTRETEIENTTISNNSNSDNTNKYKSDIESRNSSGIKGVSNQAFNNDPL